MSIKTIESISTGEYKSFNSKFIGYIYPFEDKKGLHEILAQLKKEHPKACHICYAYRVGFENEETRANDDGEPSGTAGKPILNQLLSFEVQNCLLAVVRYFGGTKLGVPGLIEAYKEAAKAALISANIIIKEEMISKTIKFGFQEYHTIITMLKKDNAIIKQERFEENNYVLEILIQKNLIEKYIEYIL